MNKKKYIIISFLVILSARTIAQTIKPDVSTIKNFQVINRDISIIKDKEKTTVYLDAKPGDGIAWVDNLNFTTGSIILDIKGKDAMQQSFVGIAFHGINDSTFDAVYFRPFNFKSTDTARRNHSVQYISMPKYDWSVLREKYPGKYESVLTQSIGLENWFHVKIIVTKNSIHIYVNDDGKASLIVQPISSYITGKIGFWVGNNSDGSFSNLTIDNN